MFDVVLLIVLMVVPAIVLHELAHGWVALKFGDQTAKDMGRLTLNPIKHIDPLGSVIIPGALFLISRFTHSLLLFGWAKPVPVNFRNLKPLRLGIISVALAGPLTNICLAWMLVQVYKIPALASWNYVVGWGILLNLTLAVFNMIPIPPLDGSRVVTALLPRQLAYYYNRLEPFGMIVIVVFLQLGLLQFMNPLVNVLGSWMGIEL
jgi:Zn-dependent protease